MSLSNTKESNMDAVECTKIGFAPVSEESKMPQEPTEHVEDVTSNLEYDDDDEEPEIYTRTYVAVASMCLYAFVGLWAIQGPAAVLTYIGEDLNGAKAETWVASALIVPEAVLAPVISSVADTFQARKWLIVGLCTIAIIGSGIGAGSQDIYRLIAAQTLIGFGLIAVPLTNVIPSEVLPRKWRPMAQACFNFASIAGASVAPLVAGALTKADQRQGWRTFYWIQLGLWAVATLGIIFGYWPPKRHTRYDHLSLAQKLRTLDIVGSVILTVGLTLFLVGVSLGGGLYAWTDARVLSTLVIGIVALCGLCLYEWKGTKTGILHHNLFSGTAAAGRNFSILLALIAVEGILFFAFVVFYPIATSAIFSSDPFIVAARGLSFWGGSLVSTFIWGYIGTRFRTIREPLLAGFVFFTAGTVGMATLQPDQSAAFIVSAAVAGIGFGSPIVLINAGVQLNAPHNLIATATAVIASMRCISATIFTAIFTSAFQSRLNQKLPAYIAKAALEAGLPAPSVPAFVKALATNNMKALFQIHGVTDSVIAMGVIALEQAFADSLRIVFIIAAPFGAVACVACLFLGDVRKRMNYHVDAPAEILHAKRRTGRHTEPEMNIKA